MVDAPPLLLVKLALPPKLQGLHHVLQVISGFVIPNTIDGAVYNNLQRIIRAYEPFRPYTVGAMDGAAARGRASLLQWLHFNRSEGCSTAAFVGAASNGNHNTLKWLHKYYPSQCNPDRELAAAAGYNQGRVIRYLQRIHPYSNRDAGIVVQAAAANGLIELVESYHPHTYDVVKPFLAAAQNGHAAVLRVLIERHRTVERRGRPALANLEKPALKMAVQGGHGGVVELLIEHYREAVLTDELAMAATCGHNNVVELLLQRFHVKEDKILQALLKAIKNNHCAVVKVLLDRFSRNDISPVSGKCNAMSRVQTLLEPAFLSAVGSGYFDMVKLLLSSISLPVSRASVRAARTHQLAVLEMILGISKDLKDDYHFSSIATVAEIAASTRSIDMARLLVSKCTSFHPRRALLIAVENNYPDLLAELVKKSSPDAIVEAAVFAAVQDRQKLLELLLTKSTGKMVERILLRAASDANPEMVTLVLGRCNPAAYTGVFSDAASLGLLVLVQMLLERVNRRTIGCALVCAAANGHAAVVENLMDKSESSSIICAFDIAAHSLRLDDQ
ncbi:hypothetical protein F444_09571 [Phytophthora nicotianae P1976]|uniref:Uncharacterized protein n=1 Tax=Phytophthora nicotianae P1976 TaxID=1317066 RepID=A0A081A7B0_PHYNI|nr:hypothetical protein F444_09571 [Phytophthora nicotianae P1976]